MAELRSGTVFTAGCCRQNGIDRINYRLRDSNDMIFYLSIAATGGNPFHHADTLRLEVRAGVPYLNGRLARREKDLGKSYLD